MTERPEWDQESYDMDSDLPVYDAAVQWRSYALGLERAVAEAVAAERARIVAYTQKRYASISVVARTLIESIEAGEHLK